MNDGGNVLVAGQAALQGAFDQFLYNPHPAPPAPFCRTNQTTGQNDADDPVGQKDNCIAVSNDFMQYWLGAYLPAGAALSEQMRENAAVGDTVFSLNGAGTVAGGTQPQLRSFLTTTSLIPTFEAFKAGSEFGSDRGIEFNRKPSFDPPTGDWYVASGSANYGYKRLTKTIDLTGKSAAELAFKISYDTEPDYDYVFVEARTAGGDDWRTLPDLNGHTDDDTGVGCAEDNPYWLNTHPHLRRYITRSGPDAAGHFSCAPSASGIWNAATGNSAGFQDWKVALERAGFAGDQVEVSIVYQTDPGTAGLGVFVDDATITSGGQTVEETSFETGLDGWPVPGPPAYSPGNATAGARSQSIGLVDGPGVRTPHSLLWGFGLEGVDGADKRAALISNAMKYFGAAR